MALTKVTGSVIKDSVSLSGNVSVGGTLTYQDVTNVDALGIGTFRTGIKVLAGQVDVGSNIKLGNAGVITATSFVGSGANLTGLPAATTINNNANNRLITGSGTANTLEAESTLTYDQDTLSLTRSANAAGGVYVYNSNNSQASAIAQVYVSGGDNAYGSLQLECNSTNHSIRQDGNGHLKFFNASTERLRITSSGQLLLGTTSGSELLMIKRDDAIGPTITLENNANKTYINNWGATGQGSGRTNRFEINATLASQASYCAPYHTFMIGGVGDSNEKIRIDSSGNLILGATSYQNGGFGGTSHGINIAGTQPQILLHETDTNKDGYFGLAGSILRIQTADAIPVTIWTSDTRRVYIHETNGNMTLETGNLVIGTAGKGIDFSVDGNASGSTSELLDDFEEGSFTVAVKSLNGGTMNGSYSQQSGRYTKIGRMVHIRFDMTWSGWTNASGAIQIDNLPFTNQGVSSSGGYGAPQFRDCSGLTNDIKVNGNSSWFENNSNRIRIMAWNSSGVEYYITPNQSGRVTGEGVMYTEV